METFSDRAAVITGGASGIGLAMAEACGAEGMRVAILDLPGKKLDSALEHLRGRGISSTGFGVDVRDAGAMREVSRLVRMQWGEVHLLCNNAGISGLHRRCWNFSDEEWGSLLDINLRGVINGLQAFLPYMVDQTEGHIVNTASMAGLIPTPMNAPYCASKFAVVGITETLALDLRDYGSRVGVSVLCPGLVRTAIVTNRTAQAMQQLENDERRHNEAIATHMETALDPADLARQVLAAVREGRFYVLTHPEGMPLILDRQRWIAEGGCPTFPG